MTAKQRAHLFRDLWPAACEAQGWHASDAERRREVTKEVTGKASSKDLTEPEITKLFDHLKFLAAPVSIAAALPVANPELQKAEDEKRRLVWVIERFPVDEAFVARIALAHTRREKVDSWPELSVESLRKLRYTLTARCRKKVAEARGEKYEPRKDPWHLRPEVKKAKQIARGCGVPPEPNRTPLVVPEDLPEDAELPF